MEIGSPLHEYVVEPVEDPVPREPVVPKRDRREQELEPAGTPDDRLRAHEA